MDLLISFDDTGSMYSVRQQVRRKLRVLVDSMIKVIPDLRIAVIVHNDYCDAPKHISILKFTQDIDTIKEFIDEDSPQGGGDSDECYELVLHEATKLNWESSKKAMILIGDALPHKKGERNSGITVQYDWREEANKLGDMGIQIYGVQAQGWRGSTHFYEGISDASGGIKLDLNQFQHINTYIKAIAFRQESEEALENYIKSDSSFTSNHSLQGMFAKLRGKALAARPTSVGVIPEGDLSKFQVFDIDSYDAGSTTKSYIESLGQAFKKGRFYYQLVKSEKIQADKHVLMVDKATGAVNTDTMDCRKMLGVPYGVAGKLNKTDYTVGEVLNKYNVFIQSNSYNRKLDANTKLLYEIDKF